MRESFCEFSSAVTGFSNTALQGTGLVDIYWETLVANASPKHCALLFETWDAIAHQPADTQEALLEKEVFANDHIGDLARNIVKMWYLGQWSDSHIVSGEAYQLGLVWEAAGAHPQGARQPGFGTWSLPPDYIAEGVKS